MVWWGHRRAQHFLNKEGTNMGFIKEERKITKLEDIVIDCICDSCGCSMVSDERYSDFIEGVEMNAVFGYGSKRDDERYNIVLCDRCFDKMVEVMGIDLVQVIEEDK